MSASVKQRSRVRLDQDGYPSRYGNIAAMFWHWRESTGQYEWHALVHWDEAHDSWHWVADLVAIKDRALGAPRIGRRR